MSDKKKTAKRGANPGARKRSGSVRTGSKKSGAQSSTKTSVAVSKKTSVKKPLTPKSPAKKADKPTRGAATAKTSSAKKAPAPRQPHLGRKPTAKSAPTLVSPPKRRAKPAPASDDEQDAAEEKLNMPTKQNENTSNSHSQEPEPRDIGADDTIAADHASDDEASSEPFPLGLDVGMLGIGSPLFPPNTGVDLDDAEADTDADGDSSSFPSFDDDLSVEMRIREIEDRLDGLMASEPSDELDVDVSPSTQSIAPGSDEEAVDAARELLESDYYRKKWGRSSLRDRSCDIDDFGLDPDFEAKLRPALDFLFKRYFRVEVEGIRHVPSEGRGVVVANHSGALPFDGVMLREAIRNRHSSRDDLRWLAEDFSFYLPFLGVTLNRLGAVRACPENAERLLEKEHLVGVFPEGAEGTKKLFKERYKLQRFGRGGFVRLCLKTGSPIVPCAIIGAEETNPVLYRFDNLSKLLGLDYLPITPTFPFLGPLGLLPAPTKWKIVFGEPISLAEYGPEAAQDHVLVGRLSERVRSAITELLDTSLRRRKSIWL